MVSLVVSETWTHPDSCEFSPCPHKERRQAGHDQHTGKASLYHSGVIPEKKACSGDNNLTIINSTEELSARASKAPTACTYFTSPDVIFFICRMLGQTLFRHSYHLLLYSFCPPHDKRLLFYLNFFLGIVRPINLGGIKPPGSAPRPVK